MCDVKLQNPFQKQESPIKENIPFQPFSLTYKDPTVFEDLTLSTNRLTKTIWEGNITFEIFGDICDYNNYIEANGLLKIGMFKTGPLETKGGVIQFKRLFFNFSDLEIPVKIKYEYNPETLCNESTSEAIETNYFEKHIVDASSTTMEKRSLFTITTAPTSERPIKFNKYYVTNSDTETNMNNLFNNLESEIKKIDTFFLPFYNFVAYSLPETELGKKIENEFKRIICLSKKSSNETVKTGSVFYKEKIDYLKEMNLYSLIRSNKL